MRYFYKGMELDVPAGVYCPAEDSELLAGAIEEAGVEGKKALEIGCGSGLLSILMAKNGADVTAADMNPAAVDATRTNAAKNSLRITVVSSDLFEGVDGKFDFVVFNPPYLPDGGSDPTYSGGKTGRETIEKFIMGVKGFLSGNGIVLMVISSLTGEKEVLELFRSEGMSAAVLKREKIPWEELIVIRAKAC